jgi:hypothetical protein
VFRDRGVSATLNDVAHHAGLGVGTVYLAGADPDAAAGERGPGDGLPVPRRVRPRPA